MKRFDYLYTHISGPKQKEDLERQKQFSPDSRHMSSLAISALASASSAKGLRPYWNDQAIRVYKRTFSVIADEVHEDAKRTIAARAWLENFQKVFSFILLRWPFVSSTTPVLLGGIASVLRVPLWINLSPTTSVLLGGIASVLRVPFWFKFPQIESFF
ncbi:hypothetical protein G9A89_019843 [Geosiphon pyriformis]|nr:hypothetical protein G9A89_019843 [Geosiphon pyriformis]